MICAIDFKHPGCYFGCAPTLALAAELGIELQWMPMLVPALSATTAAAEPGESRGQRHRRIRANYRLADAKRYGERLGLPLHGLGQPVDSRYAAMGLIWINQRRPEAADDYVQRMFHAFWSGESADMSVACVTAVLRGVEVAADSFARYCAGEGEAALAAHQAELAELGVFDVPGYLLDGEVFTGRAHLPLLRLKHAAVNNPVD